MPPETDQQNFGVAVGRIQSDVMHILSTLVEMKENQKKEYEKLDGRITAVERFMWRFAGVVSLFPFVFTFVLWLVGMIGVPNG